MTDLTEREEIILRYIRNAARVGAPCPSNHTFGIAVGGTTASTSKSVLITLQRKGAIEIERRGNQRKITIVAEGLSTADLPPPDKRSLGARQTPLSAGTAASRTITARQEASNSRRLGLGRIGYMRSLRGADGPKPPTCQYPLGDDPKEREFCGKPRQKDSPAYCAEHHAACYLKPKDENEVAA